MPVVVATVQAAADTVIATVMPLITAHQNTFFGNNARYWQGLRSHSSTPVDGSTSLPTVNTSTPSDETVPYPLSVRTTSLPFCVQVHKYNGPSGQGYATVFESILNGNKWQRIINTGPETYRDQPWTQILN